MITTTIIILLVFFIVWREAKYAQRQRFYQRFIEELPFEAVAMDSKLRHRLISRQAVKSEEMRRWMIGKTDLEYWRDKKGKPEIGEKRQVNIQAVIDSRQPLSFNETMKGSNGQMAVFTRRLMPIFDKKGDIYMFLGFGVDFTEDLKREKQLEKLNNDLNKSNEDLANFAHVASHDLKAPLRSITSFLQLLNRRNKDKFDDTDNEYISFAMNSAKQMHRLIESLLNYSQIDKQSDEPVSINLTNVIELTKHNLYAQIEEKKAQVTFSEMPNLTAFDFHIKQLFQNLIQNGLKYNRSEMPAIHISTTKDAEKGLIFCVKDNGIGIEPEFHDKIFQVFRRLHNATEFEGTGIGLAACKRIVEFYEGSIWLASEPEKGTTFFFNLPRTNPIFEQ